MVLMARRLVGRQAAMVQLAALVVGRQTVAKDGRQTAAMDLEWQTAVTVQMAWEQCCH